MRRLIISLVIVTALVTSVEAFRTTVTHVTKDVTTTSALVLPANISRNFLRITNESTSNIWCAFGGTAAPSSGVYIMASGVVTYDYKVPTVAVHCIHQGSGSKKLHLEEGVGP